MRQQSSWDLGRDTLLGFWLYPHLNLCVSPNPAKEDGERLKVAEMLHFLWWAESWDMTSSLLLLFSHSVLFGALRRHGLQHTMLPCPSLSPRVCSNSGPLSWWCHPTISSSVAPSLLALNLSQHQGLFQWVGSLHQVTKVLELQLQHQSFQWIFMVDFL